MSTAIQEDSTDQQKMREAITAGDDTTVGSLIEKGVALPTGKEADSLLCHVAVNTGDPKTGTGYTKITQRLLKAGADPNAAPYEGQTLLNVVVYQGNEAGVKMLLAAKADPNRVGDGMTSVNNATMYLENDKMPAIIKMLLAAGADPNTPNSGGWTPLHNALHQRNEAVIKMLLEAGANPNIAEKNGTGKTPLQLATSDSIRELLISHGAKPEAVKGTGEPAREGFGHRVGRAVHRAASWARSSSDT